jgi:hypothetical protein
MGLARSISPTANSNLNVKETKKNRVTSANTSANTSASTSTSTSTSTCNIEEAHTAASSPSQEYEQEDVRVPQKETNDSNSIPRSNLKLKLRSVLCKYNGSTKPKEVVKIVNELAKLNPFPKDCARLDLFHGEYYTLTAPSFPGRVKPINYDVNLKEIVQYTLGRLSFNIFQPNELVCTVRSIRNPVRPLSNTTSTDAAAAFSYNFIVDITIHTPDGDLEATLINRGNCRESDDVHNRMMCTFTGGTLVPSLVVNNDTTMLKLWGKTFAKAYEKADKERSYFGWMYQYFLKLFLGLNLPIDVVEDSGSDSLCENAFHFDIKRPPKGYFDVLYLDHDFRITKGNRGTICVLERSASNGYHQ